MRNLLAALVFLAAPAAAQDWAKAALEKSPRHLEWAEVESAGRKLPVFVAYPESKKKTPVVLVIHEIFGMTDWVRMLADELAAAGYIAVAPDLLAGAKFSSVDDARAAVSKLDAGAVYADLSAVADWAAKLPASSGKLASAGFCWGGGRSFEFAKRPGLNAAFVFYGPAPQDVAGIKAPVYGFYAGNDARINAGLPAAEAAMKAAKKKYQYEVYEGGGHGFMRAGADPGGSADNKAAREKAWKRWKTLLKKL